MVYAIGALMTLIVLWFLITTQERSLDMERRFWIELHRTSRPPVAERRSPSS